MNDFLIDLSGLLYRWPVVGLGTAQMVEGRSHGEDRHVRSAHG
jgi:hypothetical protein